jgi:hypothetical protein
MDTPPPQEVVPSSIPQTPNSQVKFCYKSSLPLLIFSEPGIVGVAAGLQAG